MRFSLAALAVGAAFSMRAFGAPRGSRMAAALVTSREWHVKRGKDTIEEFSGDVHYHGGRREIFSDRAVFDHASQEWTATGHVRAARRLDSGETWTAEGSEAEYGEAALKGRMRAKGQVEMTRRAPDGSLDRAAADRLDWSGDRRVLMDGRARSWGPRMDSWSDRALITDAPGPAKNCATRRVELRGGRPAALKLRQDSEDWFGAVKADVLKSRHPRGEASEGEVFSRCGREKFWAVGRVRGWIVFKKYSGKKSESRAKK